MLCSNKYLDNQFCRKMAQENAADGLRPNQGVCDDSIGNSICDPGFEGIQVFSEWYSKQIEKTFICHLLLV